MVSQHSGTIRNTMEQSLWQKMLRLINYIVFESIDHAPPSIPNSSHSTQLCFFEDNVALIQVFHKVRKPTPKARHKNAQSRFGLVVWDVLGSVDLDKVRANNRSMGGYFDKENVHHDAMAFIVSFVANQTTL